MKIISAELRITLLEAIIGCLAAQFPGTCSEEKVAYEIWRERQTKIKQTKKCSWWGRTIYARCTRITENHLNKANGKLKWERKKRKQVFGQVLFEDEKHIMRKKVVLAFHLRTSSNVHCLVQCCQQYKIWNICQTAWKGYIARHIFL